VAWWQRCRSLPQARRQRTCRKGGAENERPEKYQSVDVGNKQEKNIKSKLELASFCVLHATTDTSRRRETAVVPRSSKHGHGRLVLTNTRRPWHGVPGCVCEVLTTARQSIVCGRARPARPHNYRPIDCVQSWSSDCAVVRSAFMRPPRT